MTVTTNEAQHNLRIDYETQVVHHGNRGVQLIPGGLSALGIGAWIVRGLIDSSPVVAGIGTAAGTYAVTEGINRYESEKTST